MQSGSALAVTPKVQSAQEAEQLLAKLGIKSEFVRGKRVTDKATVQVVEMILSGQADVFSHVVPMLVNAQANLPGSRILPGSYYNVPIAIGYRKGAPAAVASSLPRRST